MRRPGLWVANGTPGHVDQMYSWRPGSVGCQYNYLAENDVFDYKAANPTAPVIIRFQHPLNWHQNLQASAQQLGQFVAGAWREIQPLDPYVYFASHMNMHYANGDPNPANQPRYTTQQFYQIYANWVRMTADVIKNIVPEMKLVTPPFAFGFNEDGSPDNEGNPMKGWAGFDYLQETIRDYFDNMLTFHAFWGYPAGGSVPDWLYEAELSSWYAFRWQRILQLFAVRYNINARIIIDQAASFGPADPDFTDQLIYFAQQCLGDPRVVALVYALWADTTNNPIYQRLAWTTNVQDLADHLLRLSQLVDIAAPDSPVPFVEDATDLSGIMDFEEPGPAMAAPPPSTVPAVKEGIIRVLMEDDTVQVMPLEAYLRGVVPGEMPALWPEEALKVQAVAARTYAQRSIEHPRHHPRADICTTVHCQHHDVSKIHARTDKAIEETRGIILQYKGETATAVYSARCGGQTRTNEDVWKSSPVPYLRSVSCPDTGEKFGHGVGMCQHGARVFAEQGRSYDEILKHYYQGISLGTVPST